VSEFASGRDPLEEIAVLYRSHFSRFLRVATAVTADAELARDSVQEAFANAIRHRSAYRGEGTLEAWLWSAVVNAARTNRKTAAAGDLAGDVESAFASLAEPADPSVLRACIGALPERQRLVLFLRYYADLDYQTIADTLAIQPGTVAAALNAAHTNLRPLLEEAGRERL
jgi:RNA polymerase sigma factor (sigma-70 family)